MNGKGLFFAFVTILLIGTVGGFWIASRTKEKQVVEEEKPPAATIIEVTQKPIGGETDEHGCYLTAGYSWCAAKQKCLRPWEEECKEEEATEEAATAPTDSDKELITAAFAEKYDRDASEVNVSISKNTGELAQGSISFAGEMGVGIFFAAKVEGEWIIIYDGHGTIPCADIEPYDFPTDMIPKCFDEETGDMVTR